MWIELLYFAQVSEKAEFELIHPNHFSTCEKMFKEKAPFNTWRQDAVIRNITSNLPLTKI